MKTTYYYGIIEFGYFQVGEGERSPLAIIHRINEAKEFDRPSEAWEHWVNSNGGHESYISVDAKDENDVQYELVFKQHR